MQKPVGQYRKACPRDEFHDLRKQRLANVHGKPPGLVSIPKSYPVLAVCRSNRLQTKYSLTQAQQRAHRPAGIFNRTIVNHFNSQIFMWAVALTINFPINIQTRIGFERYQRSKSNGLISAIFKTAVFLARNSLVAVRAPGNFSE